MFDVIYDKRNKSKCPPIADYNVSCSICLQKRHFKKNSPHATCRNCNRFWHRECTGRRQGSIKFEDNLRSSYICIHCFFPMVDSYFADKRFGQARKIEIMQISKVGVMKKKPGNQHKLPSNTKGEYFCFFLYLFIYICLFLTSHRLY
jgi:hypothetical protein